MKKFRILFAVIGFVFAASATQAQSDKADKIIAQSQKKFNSLDDVQAQFVYTLSNPNLEKPIVKKGKITLRQNKYRIIFPDEEMYCDGKYVWVKMNLDEEIIKSDYDPDGAITPARLYNEYENGTKSRYDGLENGQHKVTLFASNDSGDIWKTELWINKGTKLIDKAIMHSRNGSEYMFELNEIVTDQRVPDSVFELNESKYEAEDWIITDQSEL